MIDTDKAWEKWGSEDPYYGVLANERFRATQIDRNHEEFFATGRRFTRDLLKRYESQFGPLKRERVLDHGCGVGRLAIPLAQEFAEVVALDVAPSMLSEAQSNAQKFGTKNARFALADDALANAPGDFDFVNSHIVLQHIPVRRGLRILSGLMDKVRPGGGFHVHLSFRTESAGWRLLYWSSANIPGVKVWQNICAGRRWNAPAMQMNHYPLHRIVADLTARGMKEFLVTTEPHARFITCSLLGRKPEQTS